MIVLAALNAKYIHSNLAVYALKAYAEGQASSDCPSIRIMEYTINQPEEEILGSLYETEAKIIAFSCYIWNVEAVRRIGRELKKIRPDIQLWAGGPEVSFHAELFLKENPFIDLVMLGEGEWVFTQLIQGVEWNRIPGIAYRTGEQIRLQPPAGQINLDTLPFVYQDMSGFAHKIVYYESSRGCPFRCSYCLSSIDKQVRFRSLDLVKKELQFFLDEQVPQVKFIDRTFNCNPIHAMAVWSYIYEHDNEVTNFHFEISADLLTAEQLGLLQKMRKGLVQFEIGLQTTNPDTIQAIERHMDIGKIRKNIRLVHSFGNIHQHLDLIAGLPWENLERFRQSFDEAYGMETEQLQLGFLKVLKGSKMERKADEYEMKYTEVPPYEVLSTKWLSYSDVLVLKRVEEMLEVYHNSGQFRNSLRYIMEFQNSAFDFFRDLGEYYREKGWEGLQWKRLDRYTILRSFLESRRCEKTKQQELWDRDKLDRLLLHDLYLRENLKKRPAWAKEYKERKKEIAEFFRQSGNKGRMMHLEPWQEEERQGYMLYDYEKMDVFHRAAGTTFVSEEEFCRSSSLGQEADTRREG